MQFFNVNLCIFSLWILQVCDAAFDIDKWFIPVYNGNDVTAELTDTISESASVGDVITSVQANNIPTTYEIVSQSTAGVLAIDNSGQITVASTTNIDYELVRSYTIVVHAKNDATATGTATLTINVDDVNDNEPVFEAGNITVCINSTLEADIVFATLLASDVDSGVNNDLTYSIASGDNVSVWDISPFTGQLSKASPVNLTVDSMYSLVVEAVDSGSSPLSGSVTITVCIDDGNNNNAHVTQLMTALKILTAAIVSFQILAIL